jgi:Fic family protein
MSTSFSQPHQFEPLLLGAAGEPLEATATAIIASSTALHSAAHPTTRERLRELLRAMNSYYSNWIEGQGTHPLNIERALREDFSTKPNVAHLQRIARAYMKAEQSLEALVGGEIEPLSGSFAVSAHRALYSQLAAEDRRTPAGKVLEPGELRTDAVEIGRHVPPAPPDVPAFLSRYDAVYGTHVRPEQRMIALACAHHRLAWVHPFEDGNGRAGRLVTHAALFPTTGGLWSLSRGLARRRDEYYERLAGADAPRRGDLDGRGNLSLGGLVKWCRFFLDVCLDQVRFMTSLLDLDGIKERLRALVLIKGGKLKVEVALPLHHLFTAGPVTRGEFKQLTGLGERTAQMQLALLLKSGLLESSSALGAVRIGFPLDSLNYLFPDLYPEAATRPEEE